MGASLTLNSTAEDAEEQLKNLTENRLFAVLDTFGSGW